MKKDGWNRASFFLILFACAALVSACARKPVYIPPEYSSAPRQPAYTPAPQQAEPPPPVVTPQFKSRDLPESPATPPPPVAPAAQPPKPRHPVQQKAKPEHPKPKVEKPAKTPQQQESMHLVNKAKGPLGRQRPDLAIPILEKAIRIDPRNGEAFLLLAKSWKLKGQRKKAIEFAKKAELLSQGQPARLKEVYLLESELYREMGENAKAGQLRKKASSPKKPAAAE